MLLKYIENSGISVQAQQLLAANINLSCQYTKWLDNHLVYLLEFTGNANQCQILWSVCSCEMERWHHSACSGYARNTQGIRWES